MPPTADHIWLNGHIPTPSGPVAALAIGDGRILYTGDETGARAYAGASSRLLDLGGRTVLPGFIDAHCHPIWNISQTAGANLHPGQTVEAYLALTQAFAQAHPGAQVVRGAGWRNTVFPGQGPDRALLDALIPDRPVVLHSEDFHSVWVNTQALQAAGIAASTADPPGGHIERDAQGEPTGVLREASHLLDGIMPPYTTEEWRTALLDYQARAYRAGITAVHDASLSSETIAAYAAADADGTLSLRVFGAYHIDPDAGSDQFEAAHAARLAHSHGNFQIRTAKIFVDGVIEGGTGYLLEPYAHRPGYHGELMWDPDRMREAIVTLDAAGWQIHLHTIGDGAVRLALDALETARQRNGARDARHILTHLQLVHPHDVTRMRDLGVVAVVQPFWFVVNDYFWNLEVPYLGRTRADAEYPMHSLLTAGVRVAASSDFPVTDPFDPLLGIQHGVVRAPYYLADPPLTPAPGQHGVLNPAERVTVATMIECYTAEGAYANFAEASLGRIAPGYTADLVVLATDPSQVTPTSIHQIPIEATMQAGRIVHSTPALTEATS